MRSKKFFILIPIIFVAALPYAVMQLWNHIVMDLFAFKSINYLQALGLFVLCRILFGRFSWGPKHRMSPGARGFGEKWMHMNAAEREQMKTEWQKRKNSC
ncbi:MAG: hypothetical protein JNJ58_11975 [Chitinophagaceae bacterium]|nr:hypothetical protein [Chitinophagaceae bacterium]